MTRVGSWIDWRDWNRVSAPTISDKRSRPPEGSMLAPTPHEGAELATVLQVPDGDGAVPAAGGDRPAVGGDGDGVDPVGGHRGFVDRDGAVAVVAQVGQERRPAARAGPERRAVGPPGQGVDR